MITSFMTGSLSYRNQSIDLPCKIARFKQANVSEVLSVKRHSERIEKLLKNCAVQEMVYH